MFRNTVSNIIEYIFWMIVSLLCSLETIVQLLELPNEEIREYIFFNPNSIINPIVILLFPILFNLAFGKFPILLIRDLIKKNKTPNVDNQNALSINNTSPLAYLQSLSNESDKLAKKVFNRSNTYLFTGSFIAILGILYFSFEVTSLNPIPNKKTRSLEETVIGLELLKVVAKEDEKLQKELQKILPNLDEAAKNISKYEENNLSKYIVMYLPRFGSLLFVEFIAFFFLRQYRITMDEFKYYETLKRQREELLFKIKYLENENINQDIINIIKKYLSDTFNKFSLKDTDNQKLFTQEEVQTLKELIVLIEDINKTKNIQDTIFKNLTNPDILNKEHTTELIEKRKITKDDTGVVEKLIEALTKLRTK